jgi:hypothetical protein
MQFNKSPRIALILIIVLVSANQIVLAQTDVTPTQAPSKTPTDPPATPTPVTEVAPEFHIALQPRTQADLSILTGNVQRPNGIVWHNGKLYTACNGDFTLYEIDATTAATRTYIFGVRNAHTLYAEAGDAGRPNLWVPDFETNRLLFIDGTGVPRPVITDLRGPWGIAYLDEDRFLITNQRGDSLIVVGRDGTVQNLLDDLRLPTGVAADEEFIYVANYGRPRYAIEWLNKADIPDTVNDEAEEEEFTGDLRAKVQTLVSGIQNTTGIVLAADGYLYFAYALGTRGAIGRVDPQMCRENGGCTNDQVEIVVYTELAAPLAGLTISPDMRLFVHTMFSPDIYWVQLND